MDECCRDLSGIESALYIRDFCKKRVEKYNIYTVKSGACKGCPFRYRGNNPYICCLFGNTPYTWSDESIARNYRQYRQ